jgi:hypothetical protein
MATCSRNACGCWRPDLLIRLAKLGLWLDDAWFCSDGCVRAEALRRLRQVRPINIGWPGSGRRLGDLLVYQRAITPRQLKSALESQRKSGLRLGAELRRLGHVDGETVLRALSAQTGVSYLTAVDPASVRHAPGGLSPEETRALGVVPFCESEPKRLLVACAAPVPRSSLAALEALIGCTVEPFLVGDEDFDRLMQAYCAAAADSIRSATALDIDDGASCIAAMASTERSVTVTEARVEPFTYVRIAANGKVRSLLVPPSPKWLKESQGWLAVTTRH